MRPLLLVFALVYAAVAADVQHRTFVAGARSITFDVQFFPPYQGNRLAFYRDEEHHNPICWSGAGETRHCPDHFVGSVATVTYTVRRAGKLQRKTAIREYVTVISQSPDLPPRQPAEKTQMPLNGVITDVQAFGYDETDISEGERETVRKKAKDRLWRLCRQELYLESDTTPFAILTWRYTLDAIEIVDVRGNLQR
jgi:hypothetical protein